MLVSAVFKEQKITVWLSYHFVARNIIFFHPDFQFCHLEGEVNQKNFPKYI